MQTMSGPQTLETWERAACNHAGLRTLQCKRQAAVCAAGYCGILPRLRRMDIADTGVLCSAEGEMGTSHSKLPTERESWILWNLHFNSHSTQKCQEPLPYKMIHWKPGRGEGKSMWRESDSGENWWAVEITWVNISQKVFTVYHGNFKPTLPNCPLSTSFNCYEELRLQQTTA